MNSLLYVITDLELGGVPLHLRRLALAARDRGFTPTVASLRTTGPVGEMLRANGIEVLTCEGRSGRDVRVIARLARIIARRQPDLIHAFLFHANQAARFAGLLSRFPRERIIAEIQTVEVERRWHLWFDHFTQHLSRFTIGNSPSVVEHLHRASAIPRHRLRLVPGGTDIEPFRSAMPVALESIGLPEDARVLLWVGRLDPVKGLDLLIDAVPLVCKADPRAHLVLVGDGPLRATLERQIASRNLGSRVHLLGARNDVPALLRAADVFVFPSRTEGLPNALLEAMAAGLPIVTTDVPGCRDLVEHGSTGLLVPFGDATSLASAILRVVTDSELADGLGASAAACATQNWSLDGMKRGYLAAYEEALAT